MSPVAKALWFIESHFAQDLSLHEVAAAAGVSRYHMSRAFGLATGISLMRYVWGRRLTEAAHQLVRGAPDILTVALDAGYSSHEAFTRAFRDQFGVTPEALRAQGKLDNIPLMEPIKMNQSTLMKLEPPRFEDGRALMVAGLSERYNYERIVGIPAQWQRFAPYIGHIPGQVGYTAYGVCGEPDEQGGFEYISGVEVSDASRVPEPLKWIRIPEQRYAIFLHTGHISAIGQTWTSIMDRWIPESGLKLAEAPQFERYDNRFNPATGAGVLEIWIPVVV